MTISEAVLILREKEGWRCFHCDEVFHSTDEAREHFGDTPCSTPLCQVDLEQIRDLENQLRLYRDEDTDLHRKIASMETQHTIDLMRAEEQGYARGLRDGRTLKLFRRERRTNNRPA